MTLTPVKTPDVTLCFTYDSVPEYFNLTALSTLSQVFFTWESTTPQIDAGPSEVIARVLSEALCSSFNLVYLSSMSLTATSTWERRYGYYAQLQTEFLKQSLPLVWTNEPAIAMQAFDDGWSTEGQIVLLSNSATPISFNAIALQKNRSKLFSFVQNSTDFCAVLLPGVDGDYAGLHFQNDALRAEFIEQTLANCCEIRRVDLVQKSSADFLNAAANRE